MPDRTAVIYTFDGSFDGFFCCVFESFLRKELPCAIVSDSLLEPTLFQTRYIETDPSKSERVKNGISGRVSEEALDLVASCWLTFTANKELLLLDFIRLGLHHGRSVTSMLSHPVVDSVIKAVRHLEREAHQYKGFVRFSVLSGLLISVIEPKNFVLPLLAAHFCDRYSGESFIIFDKTHRAALVYRPRRCEIVAADELDLPAPGAEELSFRSLWRLYHETIAIKERENPLCQMSHMQKRYWPQMTEFSKDPPLAIRSAGDD